jgi:hypothetical protein
VEELQAFELECQEVTLAALPGDLVRGKEGRRLGQPSPIALRMAVQASDDMLFGDT